MKAQYQKKYRIPEMPKANIPRRPEIPAILVLNLLSSVVSVLKLALCRSPSVHAPINIPDITIQTLPTIRKN
jgi:hypothetical protein